MYDPYGVGQPAPVSRWSAAASAAAPVALSWAQKAQEVAMADGLVSGIPNVALAAGAALVFAYARPRRRGGRFGHA